MGLVTLDVVLVLPSELRASAIGLSRALAELMDRAGSGAAFRLGEPFPGHDGGVCEPHVSVFMMAVKKAPAKKAAEKNGARTNAAASAGRRTSAPRRPALSPPPTDPLLVLGLRPSFSARELQRAWRNHAAKHHPDTGGDAVTFSRGRQAYETLRQGLVDDGRVG